MLIAPQPLDWDSQAHIGATTVWYPGVYDRFQGAPAFSSQSSPQALHWEQLPFEEAQLDKIPEQSGLYLIFRGFDCLGLTDREYILYIGESGNLRARLKRHLDSARDIPDGHYVPNPSRHSDRMRSMFALFESLTLYFCPVNCTADERKELEKQLIGLLDPPFNWRHRPRPKHNPLIRRPGTIPVQASSPSPAFSN